MSDMQVSGLIPNSIWFIPASYIGQAEKRTDHPLGSSEERGDRNRRLCVAHNGDQGAFLHIAYESIGGTITRTVGQHDGFLLPAYAFRRFDVFGFGGRKIIVSRSGFMGDVAYQSFFVGEPFGQSFGVGQRAAGIVAYVHNQSVAQAQIIHDFIQIAFTDAGAEASIIYITDVVVENLVIHAGGDAVVRTQINLMDAVVEITRVVLMPAPVTAYVGCGIEVDVAVAKFGQHVAQDFE